MYGMVEHTFQPAYWGFQNHEIMDRFQPQPFTPAPIYEPNTDWVRHAAPALNDPLNLPYDLRRPGNYPNISGTRFPYSW